jgi:hypothetical protein
MLATPSASQIFARDDATLGRSYSFDLNISLRYHCQAQQATATSGSISTGVWFHVAVTNKATASIGDLKMYKDGVSLSIDSDLGYPAGASTGNTTIGERTYSGAEGRRNERIAQVCFWNVSLSFGEVAALAAGCNPYFIRQRAIIGYWPLDGLQSPEPDLSGNTNNGTLTGTAYAAGPPVAMFTKYKPSFITPPPPLRQKHFRFRTDTGAADATPTWGALEDTN